MLTYNQERFVIDHLESIKYQIQHFGDIYNISFILCDDCSKDNTVTYVKLWLNENKHLFSNTIISVSECNEGIVRNYERALKLVQTNKFKILAGDDLYYKNNIFLRAEQSNFVISPTIRFKSDEKVLGINWIQNYIYSFKGNVKKKLLEMLKYRTPLEAPGIIYDSELINSDLFRTLKNYNWIEDIPEWNYFLSLDKTKISFSIVPLVMYRSDVGISTCKEHVKNLEFENELQYIKKNIQTKAGRFPRYLDPYAYKYIILELKYKNKKVYDFDICESETFLHKIRLLSEEWMKHNT